MRWTRAVVDAETLPDRFAAIADIHGNVDALRATLNDIDAQGVGALVNLGDLYSGPLAARLTSEVLAAHPMITIRGNHDRYLITQDPLRMGASDRCAYEELPQDALQALHGLPPSLRLGDVFLCHGTPTDDDTYWLEEVRPDRTAGPRPVGMVAQMAGGIDCGLMLCAHTHRPRLLRLRDGRLIVNPGSVGLGAYHDDTPWPHDMETGSPLACYAILQRGPQGWDVTHRHVPYESTAMATLARSRGREDWAHALETGFCLP